MTAMVVLMAATVIVGLACDPTASGGDCSSEAMCAPADDNDQNNGTQVKSSIVISLNKEGSDLGMVAPGDRQLMAFDVWSEPGEFLSKIDIEIVSWPHDYVGQMWLENAERKIIGPKQWEWADEVAGWLFDNVMFLDGGTTTIFVMGNVSAALMPDDEQQPEWGLRPQIVDVEGSQPIEMAIPLKGFEIEPRYTDYSETYWDFVQPGIQPRFTGEQKVLAFEASAEKGLAPVREISITYPASQDFEGIMENCKVYNQDFEELNYISYNSMMPGWDDERVIYIHNDVVEQEKESIVLDSNTTYYEVWCYVESVVDDQVFNIKVDFLDIQPGPDGYFFTYEYPVGTSDTFIMNPTCPHFWFFPVDNVDRADVPQMWDMIMRLGVEMWWWDEVPAEKIWFRINSNMPERVLGMNFWIMGREDSLQNNAWYGVTDQQVPDENWELGFDFLYNFGWDHVFRSNITTYIQLSANTSTALVDMAIQADMSGFKVQGHDNIIIHGPYPRGGTIYY